MVKTNKVKIHFYPISFEKSDGSRYIVILEVGVNKEI